MEKETYVQAHTDSFLFKVVCGHQSNLQLISSPANLQYNMYTLNTVYIGIVQLIKTKTDLWILTEAHI